MKLFNSIYRGRVFLPYLLLLLCGSAIYFFYFSYTILHLNSVLSSNTGDSLKNYFTYAYHIKNDTGLLHFSGMNFPFGEHIIYADCQPLLTFILRLMPFTHNHLIGILHTLIFISFLITPLIYYKIFRKLEIDSISSFFISLAIGLLSPQFTKIQSGHFALAYSCIIPLGLLMLINQVLRPSTRNLLVLFIYSCLVFFIHPYLAFCICVLSFITLCTISLFRTEKLLQRVLQSIVTGMAPVILFRIFMYLTDHHPGRPSEPEGLTELTANAGSLLIPHFGPFRDLLLRFFTCDPPNSEGYAYLGIAMIGFCILVLLLLPFTFKHLKPGKTETSIILSATVILLFSFGLHNKILNAFGIHNSLLNQFRASGRFAWVFYYCLPLFVFPVFYRSLSSGFSWINANILKGISVLFFCFGLFEANFLFTHDKDGYWNQRNIFNKDLLTEKEKQVIDSISGFKAQAIIPLPLFHSGSEVYVRGESNASLFPSLLYSYHTSIPVLSVLMSRTSVTETEQTINLLNPLKRNNPARALLTEKPFIILKTNEYLVPDEERLANKTSFFSSYGEVRVGLLVKNRLLQNEIEKTPVAVNHSMTEPDSNGVLYIARENRKPFLETDIRDYGNICSLDSGKIKGGRFIVSFRYYYAEMNFKNLDCYLVMTRGKMHDWIYVKSMKKLSGFYPGFGIYEDFVDLEQGKEYAFFLRGFTDRTYHISHFLLRPADRTVIITDLKDTLINNFPVENSP